MIKIFQPSVKLFKPGKQCILVIPFGDALGTRGDGHGNSVKIRAADALVKAMKNLGVRHVFGIPGGSIMPVYDALYDAEDIKHYLFKHEQGAIHAADAYGRITKKPGVVLVTSGPGATNLVTGLANAYMDSSPLVAISGQVATPILGRDGFQETDIIGVTFPITKLNMQVRSPDDVVSAFTTGYIVSTEGRPGPVLIDIPRDVLLGSTGSIEPIPKIHPKTFGGEPSREEILKALRLLLNAERPVILVGGGVCWSGAWDDVITLAEILWAPIVSTFPGKNCVPNDHPLYLGPSGMHGRLEADAALANADVVLAVGTRFSDRTVGRFKEMNMKTIIHIDIDPSEIGKNVRTEVGIVSDAKKALKAMLRELPSAIQEEYNRQHSGRRSFIAWLKEIRRKYEEHIEARVGSMKPFAPWKVLKVLRRTVPPSTIVTTGVGSHQMWCELHWDVYIPGTFITSAGLGTMGFGLPAALGAKIAASNRPVMLIDGDGSFQMTMNNLSLVRDYGLPIIAVIFDNRALMLVKQWQIYMYSRRVIATEFTKNPDFVKIAEAYGIEGYRPSSYEEIESIVRRALRTDEPVIIDIELDNEKDIVLPWVKPGEWLTNAVPPEGLEVDLVWRG
ncbi:MAG: biosynthetic-type acetolactate synthase large subunit [Desulfurococcaceae archaeon]|nr:MAG: biosynthetic-type acetolactate synthase large subunit [Desulfurococcaceae archaeon]